MAVAWQTLEEAALTLGISSRTLHRRISRGEVATRMEGGRREVQVIVPDPPSVYPSVACDTPSASVSAASDMAAEIPQNASAERVSASDTVGQMSDDVHGTVLALHEDRIRRTDLAILAYQQSVTTTAAEARRAHVHSRIAWSVSAVAVIALFLSVVWATHSLTKARGEVNHLNDTVRQLSDNAGQGAKEAEQLRKEAETARLAAATAQGQLDAAKNQFDSVKSQLEQLTQAQQAIEARLLADSAEKASSADVGQPTPPATRPAPTTQRGQPFLYWSDAMALPASP